MNKTQSSIQLHDHHTALISISTLATRFVIDFTRESYDKGRRAYREYDFRTTLTTFTRHLFNTSGQYLRILMIEHDNNSIIHEFHTH